MKLLSAFAVAVGLLAGACHADTRSLQSTAAYSIQAPTAVLNGNNITVSALFGNANNASRSFAFYKRNNFSSIDPLRACYSQGGVQITPTAGSFDEINVLSTSTTGSPASTTFLLGLIPSTSTIWLSPPAPGGNATAIFCVRYALNYNGTGSGNPLVNYREIALVVNVTLDQTYNATNLLSMKAVTPELDTTNNTVTFGCSAYVCPLNLTDNITDLAGGPGSPKNDGNPVRLCFVSDEYPSAIITNVQSLTLTANGGALTQPVLSGGSSSAAGTGIVDFVSAPQSCTEWSAVAGFGECISYTVIPWAIFTPSSLFSTNVTASGICTLQIGGSTTGGSPNSGGSGCSGSPPVYNCGKGGGNGGKFGGGKFGGNRGLVSSSVTRSRKAQPALATKGGASKPGATTAGGMLQNRRAVQDSTSSSQPQQNGDTLAMPFQTTVDIGPPPSNSAAATGFDGIVTAAFITFVATFGYAAAILF